VSIVLISEFGAVPIKAGRISGSFDAGEEDGDPGFGDCAEARWALNNKPTQQEIQSRMAK
jgi:hypothetical protein